MYNVVYIMTNVRKSVTRANDNIGYNGTYIIYLKQCMVSEYSYILSLKNLISGIIRHFHCFKTNKNTNVFENISLQHFIFIRDKNFYYFYGYYLLNILNFRMVTHILVSYSEAEYYSEYLF